MAIENSAQIVSVRIFNHTYNLRAGDGDVARTRRLADLVDKRMNEIAMEAMTADSLKLAILAALHIADELDRANERLEQTLQHVIRQSDACQELLDRVLPGAERAG
jgi:cell division protein ZapA